MKFYCGIDLSARDCHLRDRRTTEGDDPAKTAQRFSESLLAA